MLTVLVDLSESIKNVELQIESKTGIPTNRLLFTYGGKNVEKNIPLYMHGIYWETALEMHCLANDNK